MNYVLRAVTIFSMLACASCSTTARLTADQTLYTGVRKMDIESAEKGVKVPGSVAAAVRVPLSVKPNNPLISPWVRTPLPVGLWAYNSLNPDRTKGFEAWLYRTFARQPVVMERDVQPAARSGMVRDILDNRGYFGSRADYALFPERNPKKAEVGYTVRVAGPWFFSTVAFPVVRDSLTRRIADIAASSNVKPGLQYNIDTLVRERTRIATALRDRGYYWFRPEYLEYRADTTRARYEVDLQMELAGDIPPEALVPYNIGDVSLRIFGAEGGGRPDSLEVNGVSVWHEGPLQLRRSVIRRAMTLRTGSPARISDVNRAVDNLTRLGVFRYVNIETPPLEEMSPGRPLDITLSAAMNTPMELAAEVGPAYKSSNFAGPSMIMRFSNHNAFGGGEVLSLRMKGSYEWQTGTSAGPGAGSGAINSYEIGANASLVFPRMLVPRFIGRALRYGGTTTYTLGGDLLNRPRFFRMVSFNASNTYDFRTSGTVLHSFTPVRMVYNKLLHTTAEFDEAMADNPAVALSFANQFIPSGSYTFSYDRRFGPLRRDRITVQATLTSAGNLWAGLYALAGGQGGGSGSKRLFGEPFSQFFKETVEMHLYRRTGRTGTFALRLFAGAGHAYGNSRVLPYTEQFYIGGANSIRAFTVRSIGPGTYTSDEVSTDVSGPGTKYGYFDRTGEIKLEMNAEFRFPIAGGLHGALFFDAGNVWLLKDDAARPGGRIGTGADDGSGNVKGGFLRSVATGTGLGARYDLSFLVVRLDLGIGIHLPYSTTRPGYYNIPRFRDGLGLHLAIGYPF